MAWPVRNPDIKPIEQNWDILGGCLRDHPNGSNNLQDVERLPFEIWEYLEL